MAQTPPAGGKVSRRDFLKLMAAAGTVMTFAPFVDWGKFLPNTRGNVSEKTKIEIKGNEPGIAPIYSSDRGDGVNFRADDYKFEIVGSNSGIS